MTVAVGQRGADMRARCVKPGREAVRRAARWSTERSYAAEGFTARKLGEAQQEKGPASVTARPGATCALSEGRG